MKKLLFTFVGAMLLSVSNVSAQALEEGNVVLDVYYGFPNLYTTVFKAAYGTSTSGTDLKVGGVGPLGLRAEYLLSDKIGLGVDIAYGKSFVKYSEYDSFDDRTYDYDFSTTKIGVMATFNYHFIDNDALDFYGIVGAGYKNRSFKFESTDPNYTNTDVSVTLIPVAFRIGVGLRYFFTDNIGANMAVGFGQGSILNAGISAKF